MSNAYAIGTALLVGVLWGGAALAQQETQTKLQGHNTIDVNAGNVDNIVRGSNNTSVVNIGALTGDVKNQSVTVDVKNVENIVSGHGKHGCISVASSQGCQ